MSRAAVLWGARLALALSSLVAGQVRAHGAPPTVLDVLSADERGVELLRLNLGLARRRADGRFGFTCPAVWGEDLVQSTALLADGRLLVAASQGVMVVAPDDTVQAHPDPNAAGFFTQLVQTEQAVYGLRLGAQSSELVRIDADEARTVWSAPETWLSLAAGAERLVLQGAEGPSLAQLTLDEAGRERARQSAVLEAQVDYVFARTDGDDSYALVVTQGRPRLGVLEAGEFRTVAEGLSSIAGPVAGAQDTLLAIDGQLQRLRDGTLEQLASDAYVTCLSSLAGQSYGCARQELLALDAAGQGTVQFSFASLVAPAFDMLTDQTRRARCQYQWDDLRVDLLAMGVEIPEPDAGAPEPLDAGVQPDGAHEDAAAEPRTHDGGCSAPGTNSARDWPPFVLLYAVLLGRRSRQRGRASTRR